MMTDEASYLVELGDWNEDIAPEFALQDEMLPAANHFVANRFMGE
jgi:sulfur relay (sulfurtransferase) DsrC/TusE family protein